jgi:hypothetical protein
VPSGACVRFCCVSTNLRHVEKRSRFAKRPLRVGSRGTDQEENMYNVHPNIRELGQEAHPFLELGMGAENDRMSTPAANAAQTAPRHHSWLSL